MLKTILLVALIFCGQIFASTFQATFFSNADSALKASGIPDCLLPSQRFKAEELVRRLRLGGLMTNRWGCFPCHFQVDVDNHKFFPADSVMQLALFLFPSPNNMFLPNQAVSDPISRLDFRTLGLLAAGCDLRKLDTEVYGVDVNALHKEMMLCALKQKIDQGLEEDIDQETPAIIRDIYISATKYTDFTKFYLPGLFKQHGSTSAFLTLGELERFQPRRLSDDESNALLQDFYALAVNARSVTSTASTTGSDASSTVSATAAAGTVSSTVIASTNYSADIVEKMFLTLAFLKAKKLSDLTAFYNGLREGIIKKTAADACASTVSLLPIQDDSFANTVDMYGLYQQFLEISDQVSAFKKVDLQQRNLILAATKLFDISYLPVINMASAIYTPSNGRRNAPITFSDCVETAVRNKLLALIRRVDSNFGVVYDADLLPSTARPELKEFVRNRNTFAAQTSEDARNAWAALVSKVTNTRYMKPASKPNERERSCEINAGHRNVLNLFSNLLAIDFGIDDASDGDAVIAAYTRLCTAFSRDGFQVTCEVCENDELESNSKIGDLFGKLKFHVNGKPLLTFDMQTMHGETKACGSATAPKFLTDLLEQEGPESFVTLAGANTLVRMVNKNNVVQLFNQLSVTHQREFLMLLPDEADILVPLIDHFNKQTSVYTGSMYHKMLTQRVLQLDDSRANQLLFATFSNGTIPDAIKEVVVSYPANICAAADDRSANSFLMQALMQNPYQDWITAVVEGAYGVSCVDYRARDVVTAAQVTAVGRVLDILTKCPRLAGLAIDISSEQQARIFLEWLHSSKISELEIVLPESALGEFIERIPPALKKVHVPYNSFRSRYGMGDLVEMSAEGKDITGIAVGSFKPYLTLEDIKAHNTRAISFAVAFCQRYPCISLILGVGGDDFNAKLIDEFKQKGVDYRKINSYDSLLQNAFAQAYEAAGINLPSQEAEEREGVVDTLVMSSAVVGEEAIGAPVQEAEETLMVDVSTLPTTLSVSAAAAADPVPRIVDEF